MKTLYELKVKTRSYVGKDGKTKNFYETIGEIIQHEQYGIYMTLKACFNPAGVSRRENSSNIIVSMFKPKEENNFPETQPNSSWNGENFNDALNSFNNDNSEIPF